MRKFTCSFFLLRRPILRIMCSRAAEPGNHSVADRDHRRPPLDGDETRPSKCPQDRWIPSRPKVMAITLGIGRRRTGRADGAEHGAAAWPAEWCGVAMEVTGRCTEPSDCDRMVEA